MSKEEKDKIEEYQRKGYQQLIQYKKEALRNKWVLLLLSIRMSEKTLKFDSVRVNKKEFHKSKPPVDLDLVNLDQIVASDKFQHSHGGFKGLVVTKKVKLLNCSVLSYLKWLDT